MTALPTEHPRPLDAAAPAPAPAARPQQTGPRTEPEPDREGLSREILAPAAVVVVGAFMTILDATVVNVALPTLGHDLHTSIATIQWVPTIYLLSFASVIPLTGWVSGRVGAQRVWL